MRIYCFGNSHIWALVGGEGTSDVRIEHTEGDLELVGWKLGSSGATAYGLSKKGSTTGAGESIVRILDEEPGKKDVLMIFGEVDVSDHVGHHAGEDDDIRSAIDRYVEYLKTIEARQDTGLVMVTSAVPHHSHFRGSDRERILRITRKWNSLLESSLEPTGMTYVDWFDSVDIAGGSPADGEIDDSFAKNASDPGERHMNPLIRPVLVGAIRSALLRLDS